MAEVVAGLAEQLRPISSGARLDDLAGLLTAVDGTLIRALPKMAWALWNREHQAVKAHTHFDLEKHVPVKITITEGQGDERVVLAQQLEAGRIYVLDRGYACYNLFQQILDQQSSFVCRIRDNSIYQTLEEIPLSPDACAAQIVFDRKVLLGSKPRHQGLAQPLRLIAIKCTPHIKRYKIGRGGPEQGEFLLIATDRFDLEADVVALIFRQRWAVEIFFRFFKHVLGCRHLLSHHPNGIELQTYAAIMACLLIALWTGRKPTLRTYEMLCWYFTGMAELDELLAHIARLQKQD